jgi:hypothetical protein
MCEYSKSIYFSSPLLIHERREKTQCLCIMEKLCFGLAPNVPDLTLYTLQSSLCYTVFLEPVVLKCDTIHWKLSQKNMSLNTCHLNNLESFRNLVHHPSVTYIAVLKSYMDIQTA